MLARHGIVATSDPLAAQAGLEILRQGGNAIDAAVATGAVLDVTSQNDTGIGGDLSRSSGWRRTRSSTRSTPAGGRRPAGRREFFTEHARREERSRQRRQCRDGAGRDFRLRRAAEAVRHARHSRKPSSAPRGLPTRAGDWRNGAHSDLRSAVNGLRADRRFAADLPGQRSGARRSTASSAIRGLANALRLIQKDGPRCVLPRRDRRGDRRQGAGERRRDDARHTWREFQSEWIEPVSTNYHGYDVFELPPPGQGFAALEMLNILEVCVPKLGINLAALGSVRSDVLAPGGRGEEARVHRSPGQQRRSEVCGRAGRQICCRSPMRRRCAARSTRTRRQSPARPAAPTAERSI